MNETLRLGSIAGVRIGVNWSVLVIFMLLLVGLSAAHFPLLFPDLPVILYVVAGIVAAVVFFLSLLAHELAHAVVARRNDVEVEGIILWMFGGVAKLLGEAKDAGADLRIAGVGPMVSLVLGALFGGLTLLLAAAGVEGLLLGVLGWLALINVVLAVFNLVPAAPLDGGRILRSVLWHRHGDRVRAAVTAARAGRVFGFLLIALGILQLLMLPGVGGIWLALIGWFIVASASAEEQQTRVQSSLQGLRVQDVMTPDPITVPAGVTVAQALDDYILRHRSSAFPVVDAWGQPYGLLTLNRVKQVPVGERGSQLVEAVAAPMDDVTRAGPDDELVGILPAMMQGDDGRVLVMSGERLVGILTTTDVTRALEMSELRHDADSRPS